MSAAGVHACTQALAVDAQLFAVESELDWLSRVSPTGNGERWRTFQASGYRSLQPLTYAAASLDLTALRERLRSQSVEHVEHASLRSLLTEKRDELLQQANLLEQMNTDGFIVTSIALFGGNDPALLQTAIAILNSVPRQDSDAAAPQAMAGSDEVMQAAIALRAHHAEQVDGFDFPIRLVDDLDSSLVVQQGTLCINRQLQLPAARIAPLLAHEIGVHVLTRFNGRRQPLRLFESGFADYDVLQEGLATLAEYVTGFLPARRLRVLAARVVAADLAIARHSFQHIFGVLHEGHGLDSADAFDVAVRASRGGGLTKDAVYLKGLQQVLAHLQAGESLAPLLLGKIALAHRHLIEALLDEGFLLPPVLLPDCFCDELSLTRLKEAAQTPLAALYHTEPAISIQQDRDI